MGLEAKRLWGENKLQKQWICLRHVTVAAKNICQ